MAFGRNISDQELIGLCGAPNGSTLTLQRSLAPTNPQAEKTPDGVLVTIANPTYFLTDMKLIFHKMAGGCGVYIKLVVAKKHPSLTNVAGLILTRMLQQMDAIPSGASKFLTISMLAAGGRTWQPMTAAGKRWGGWVVWPKYGFDMPILSITKSTFPLFPHVPDFAGASNGCKNVSDLLTIDKGPQFWEVVGDGDYMNFDTSKSSPHRATLTACMKRKYK